MKTNIFFLAFLLFAIVSCQSRLNTTKADTEKIEDGFYLIDRIGEKRSEVMPITVDEKLIRHSLKFVNKEEQAETFIIIKKHEFVPLTLKEKPTAVPQDNGRKKLLLALNEKGAQHLKDFTQKHLNRHTAIVINGEAMTMHKVKTVIDGGHLQITRCTDNACEFLYLELQDNVAQ